MFLLICGVCTMLWQCKYLTIQPIVPCSSSTINSSYLMMRIQGELLYDYKDLFYYIE